MPVDYLGTTTPVSPIDSSSSSSSKGEGDGEEEATVCVCLGYGIEESFFFIKSGSASSPPVSPPSWDGLTIYKPISTLKTGYGCTVAVVGSFVYVIGGDGLDGSNEVRWLDTLHPRKGWTDGPKMASKRSYGCYAFSVDGKIYVMGGTWDPPFAEVWDSNTKDGGWTEIWADSLPFLKSPIPISSHGVFYEQVFAHSPNLSRLYCYHTVNDTWSVFDKSFGRHKRVSALVDDVLYYLDYTVPGVLFGLDVSAAPGRLSRKEMVEIDTWGFPVTAPGSERFEPIRFLLSVGRRNLAVLWLCSSWSTDLAVRVNCSIFKMSKILNKKGEIKSLKANFDSYTNFHAKPCWGIRRCFPLPVVHIEESLLLHHPSPCHV